MASNVNGVQILEPKSREQLQGIAQILQEVGEEVLRAEAKFPPFNSAHEGSSVLREEFEELWDHVKTDTGYSVEAEKEAIQTAVMAVRYVRVARQRRYESRDMVKGTK